MFARPNPDTVRQLMAGLRRGDKDAAGQLVEIFYPELKRLAAARMKAEPSDHTWQPTVLVNELYLKLVKIKALSESEADAFLGLATHLMRRLLIHHARPLANRGGMYPVFSPSGRVLFFRNL